MTWLGRPARAALRFLMAGVTAAAVAAVLFTGPATADPLPAPADQGQTVAYYVVTDSYQGAPEYLYEIAERFLGTGDRAMEIFELNKGRWEPGGQQVADPEVLEPDWVLRLPEDAKGDGVQVGVLPDFTPPAAGESAAAPAAPAATDPAAAATTEAAAAPAAEPASTSSNSWLIPVISVVVLLLLAGGGWFALRSRDRGTTKTKPAKKQRSFTWRRKTAPVAMNAVMGDSDAWTVDRATRVLAAACKQQSLAVPETIALVLGPETITVRLSTPDERAPVGWTVGEEGRTWWTTVAYVQQAAVDATIPEPFPRLVPLGLTDSGQVLLNLAQSGGVISLEGDRDRAYELARAWSVRLTRSPWASNIEVVRVGFDHDPAERFTGVDATTVADAARIAEASAGGVILLATAPRGRDLEYVTTLVEEPRQLWSVVVIQADEARWRFAIDASGSVETGLLPKLASVRV
ncbi:LysM peptidoglycan-binding domain-containing protein [Actinoplanes sp. CA-015351]|uniref:LysM peptidoglycan-binding domain-containing protein n=1 Tax=Actinoplanes sp. CA-015351 TaxID=3239897 RepID=UPI003D97ECBD